MNWVLYLAINLGGIAATFLLLGLLMAVLLKAHDIRVGPFLGVVVVAFIFRLFMVGVNIYHLVPFLQAEEKNWLPIIMWGLAALYWLFANSNVSSSTTQNTR